MCPPDRIPVGLFGGHDDYFTYLAKAEWGRLGNWTWKNLFTHEDLEPVHAYYFYLFLGHLSRWLHVSPVWVIQVARSFLGAVFLTLWRRFSMVTKYPGTVFALGILAGFGIFSSVFPQNSSVNYLETCVQSHAAAAGLYGFPHYLLDGIGFLLLLEAYLYLEGKKQMAVSALAGFLVSAAHPFLLAVVPGALVLHALIYNRSKLKDAVAICLASAGGSALLTVPLFVDYLQIEWLKTWRNQTGIDFTTREHLYLVTLTFGLAGVFAWWKVPGTLRNSKDRLEQIAAIWLVLAGVLAVLAPVPNRREFGFFLSLPVAILGAKTLWEDIAPRFRCKTIVAFMLVFCCLFEAGVLKSAFWSNLLDKNSYISRDFLAGIEYLQKNSSDGDVVLCSTVTGNRMVCYTQNPKPYIAHGCETLDYQAKRDRSYSFFFNGGDPPEEAKWAVLSKEWDPETPAVRGELVFENSSMKIWKLR